MKTVFSLESQLDSAASRGFENNVLFVFFSGSYSRFVFMTASFQIFFCNFEVSALGARICFQTNQVMETSFTTLDLLAGHHGHALASYQPARP